MPSLIIDHLGQGYKYNPETPMGPSGGVGTLFEARKQTGDRTMYVFKLVSNPKLMADPFKINSSIVKFEKLLRYKEDIDLIDEICFPVSYVSAPAGYIMRKITPSYKEVVNLINGKGTIQKRLDSAYRIMRAIAALHKKGYHYGDVNARNFMYDVSLNRNDLLVIDCDTVGKDPEKTGFGTPGYRDPLGVFDQHSDSFRAAKLAFLILSGLHPFASGKKALAENPYIEDCLNECDRGNYTYILDGADNSNAWAPTSQQDSFRLKCFTPELLDLFNTMFNAGLRDATVRPPAIEFAKVLFSAILRLRACSSCEFYNYVSATSVSNVCPRCGTTNRYSPVVVRLGDQVLPVVVSGSGTNIPNYVFMQYLSPVPEEVNQLFEPLLTIKRHEGKAYISANKGNQYINTLKFNGNKPDREVTIAQGGELTITINDNRVAISLP